MRIKTMQKEHEEGGYCGALLLLTPCISSTSFLEKKSIQRSRIGIKVE
jgi:hypothetical protein